jgi:galactoside O-acetyltransferase
MGDHVAIDDFCYISTALELGDYIHIAALSSIIGGREALCVMRDFTTLAAGCRLVCGSDDYLGSGLTNPTIPVAYRGTSKVAPIVLEKHVIVGTNVVIHPGVTIGEGAAIGSSATVTKDLPPWGVYVGTPARFLKARQRNRILDLEARLRSEVD